MSNFLVVFVCTGNICRSPMAEGILKDFILDEYESSNRIMPVEVMSAGTHTVNGKRASSHAVKIAIDNGINLHFHRSRLLSEPIILAADLILTMEQAHTQYIRSIAPDLGSVYELKSYERTDLDALQTVDVLDPIGRDFETYSKIFDELREEIKRVKETIFTHALEKYRA